MSSFASIIRDRFLLWGWCAVLLSALIFCIPLLATVEQEKHMLFFIVHFGIAITYHFVLLLSKQERTEEHLIYYRTIKLVLLLISAYALNREMEVFATSPAWFSALLVVLCINYLLSPFLAVLPRWCRHVSFFLYGIAMVVFLYLAIYLLPLYAVSIPGLLLLGISIHSFVPALLLVLTVYLTRKLSQNDAGSWIPYASGMVLSMAIAAAYIISWDSKVHQLNRQYVSAMAEGEDKLPLWVQVAQNVERDMITERILKTGLIYLAPNWNDQFFFRLPSRNFGEEQQVHDPLVVLGQLFSGATLLPEEARIKILESQYNARHQSLERLWTGENLKTEQVTTNVQVWPQLRLAYTEKMLTVFNHRTPGGWPDQQEGIYTFHLPEGGVVTSLSLWIEGREEKAILTTKQAATTAYQSIVGVEKRDPSVVHWQEGNTVSVRVFPVMAGSSRTFKIGVTAPLYKEGNELYYDNIWFEGPNAAGAEETVKLEVIGGQTEGLRQASFSPGAKKVLTREGHYQPRWTISFKDKGITENGFSFGGYNYSIKPYVQQHVPVAIHSVYLDINSAWTDREVAEVWKMVQSKKVKVYYEGMETVTEENRKSLFGALQQKSFSLFPFYAVKDREHAIVITKSSGYSPSISDLEESPFHNKLQARLGSSDRVKLFQLGTAMSPYIRSLKEKRCFQFQNGSLQMLAQLLNKGEFVQDMETGDHLIVHSAGVAITRQPGDATANAPDHLMRLFAYNHIMQQLGQKEKDTTAIIREAESAYVVSPLSSLIVLETQKDYDRFGISESGNSLKNASLANKGAVPEPGEWAIIIMLVAAFLLFVYKTKIA